MGHRLADLVVHEGGFVAAFSRGVELEVADAHRRGIDDRDRPHVLQLLGLVLGNVPNPVHAPRDEFSNLSFRIADDAEDDLANRGFALCALEVVLVQLKVNRLSRNHLGDLVRARAAVDGVDRAKVLLSASIGSVGPETLRENRGRPGQILQGGGKRLEQVDAHLVIPQLLDVLDPVDIALGEDAAVLGRNVVEGVHHVVGTELLAVVEGDVIPKVKFQRDRVHPLVGGRQQRLVLKGLGIPEQKRVPAHVRHDHHLAGVVVVRQGDIEIAVGRPRQRVVALARQGRIARADQSQNGERDEFEAEALEDAHDCPFHAGA